MLIEAAGLTERLAADRAQMRSMILVHVKDVNAKSVLLLERPGADRAREFPVPIVNASGVLEMFVTIIGITEDFSATSTRKSAAIL